MCRDNFNHIPLLSLDRQNRNKHVGFLHELRSTSTAANTPFRAKFSLMLVNRTEEWRLSVSGLAKLFSQAHYDKE